MTNSEIRRLRKAQLAVFLVALNNSLDTGLMPSDIETEVELAEAESLAEVQTFLDAVNKSAEQIIGPVPMRDALLMLEDLVKNN